MADPDTVEITARCLCRANQLSWHLPKSSLPLDAGICHCNSCRHGTGTLGFMACTWPLPIPELPNCSKAAFSPRADIYFCTTCGTHIFLHNRGLPWTGLALGALEDPTVCKLSMHMFLADTRDGGISVWLDRVSGIQLKKYATDDSQHEFEPVATKGGEGNLKASCRCEGVQFEIKRPAEQSSQWQRRFASSVSSCSRTEDKATVLTEESVSQGTRRFHDGKYTAGVCVCDSCRLSTGCEIMAWASIPGFNLLNNKKPLPDPPVFGTIKHYASSEGVHRYFCVGCGASIFLVSKTDPKLLKVAIGLLHDESGARAEACLHWTTSKGPANFPDGLKRGFLTENLAKQMNTWRK